MHPVRRAVCGLLLSLGTSGLLAPTVLAQTKVQVAPNPQERPPQQVWDYAKPRRYSSSPQVLNGLWVPEWALQPDSCELLLNCLHSFTAPQLLPGNRPRLRFVASGATVTFTTGDKSMLIVPFADPVILRAYQGQKLVFTHRFRVFLLPPPTVVCTLSNADQQLEQFRLTERTVSLRARPNEMLAVFLPGDARYRVSQAEISLRRANEPVGQSIMVVVPSAQATTSPAISLAPLGAEARPGDELLIRVQQLQRKNFNDQVEEVSFNQQYTIPLR
ncbi:GldM family protein [Hymenobacter jeollabukensis]|nr:GldM family protein [Hymenobacter jeollabukensis]